MKIRTLVTLALALGSFAFAAAADLAGHWTSKFDSQIGEQNYTYDFAHDGDHLTGTAHFEHSMGKGDAKLADIKIAGDTVSFTEALNIGGNEITVSYSGKIAGDTLTLTRQVGDIATEHITAQRARVKP